MAVRDALLALLTAGPAYGFQLHGGLASRTGGRRTINVGQTYATLERLTRQRLVEPAGTTDDGLPLHRLTTAGATAATAWLEGADAAGADPWDETVDRVLIARSLPDCDADAVVSAERRRWTQRRREASAATGTTLEPDPVDRAGAEPTDEERAESALVRLAASADLSRADAALAWLDAVAAEPRTAYAPRADRPRRGRRPGGVATGAQRAGAQAAGAQAAGAQPSGAQPADA
ncbi:PadR family transcriptional regulator [Agromyces ramosus]|uniref:PadR family transcriptional regulator n=2 Tax=Agromyces ramosus TaxID=33879 RepID=A0A4Q7MDV1_9MICO|nr:PadR family transcriptional regulator [Agromyces ramosus]